MDFPADKIIFKETIGHDDIQILPNMNFPISRLMMSLAASDLLYLTCSSWVFSLPLLWPSIASTWLFAFSVTFMLPLAHTGLTGSGE